VVRGSGVDAEGPLHLHGSRESESRVAGCLVLELECVLGGVRRDPAVLHLAVVVDIADEVAHLLEIVGVEAQDLGEYESDDLCVLVRLAAKVAVPFEIGEHHPPIDLLIIAFGVFL